MTPGEAPPRWEASGGRDGSATPAQLAERATAYANTVAPPTATTAGHLSQSPVKFDNPAVQVAPTGPAPESTAPPATLASSQVRPSALSTTGNGRVAVLKSAVANSALSDMPIEVPESADHDPAPAAAAPPDPLGKRLAQQARANPRSLVDQFDYQLYCMLGNDAGQPQLAAVAALPPDEQDVMAAVVDGIANFRSGVRANANQTPTEQMRPLQAMIDRLRSQADLSIASVTVCRQVEGFGKYDPIVPARVPAGRSTLIIVYCEVANFLSRQAPSGVWETQLSEQVSLYRPDGTVAWSDRKRATVDASRSKRSDYFAYDKVLLPPTLPTGPYTLRMTVTDRAANKVAESDTQLWVGGM